MNEKVLKRIMYIEDDADIRTIVQIALEQIGGFQVSICQSGMEALQEAPAFKPDLFIIDVMMPKMDGQMLLSEIRKNKALSEIPIIFLTAKSQSSEVELLLKSGAIQVIQKPFDPLTLADTVKRIWEVDYVK